MEFVYNEDEGIVLQCPDTRSPSPRVFVLPEGEILRALGKRDFDISIEGNMRQLKWVALLHELTSGSQL